MVEVAPQSRTVITPKQNTGWKRKDSINLKTMALRVVMEIITSPVVQEIDQPFKTCILEAFKKQLPEETFYDLVEYSKKSILKPFKLTSILEAVPPSVYIKNIDLLGKYRGTHSCHTFNRNSWFNGVVTDCLVHLAELKRLFTLLDGKNTSQINRIALWTKKNVVGPSNFPRILSKSVNLTSLTLRGDADDHILRIIGLNCSLLKYLDVARSLKITKHGLHNLVFKNPKDMNSIEASKNKIADSLSTFIVTLEEETLSREDIYSLGKLFDNSIYYLQSVFPDYTIMMNRDSSKLPMTLHECFGGIDKKLLGDIESLLPFDAEYPDKIDVDILKPNTLEYVLQIFNKDTRVLRKTLKVELELGIVELAEFWESGPWKLWEIHELTDLATRIPNVKKLNCRLTGSWDENWGPIFRKLEEIDCWCLHEDCTQSILRYCPALRFINIRHVPQPQAQSLSLSLLTHENLLDILETNDDMKSSVEELNIRPTSLVGDSVLELCRQCPNIKRIGDLQCWDVNQEEIAELNKVLYKANHQCVLVVFDYPPRV